MCVALTANAQQPPWYSKAKEVSLLNSNYLDVIRIYDLGSKVNTSDFDRFEWSIDVEEGTIQIYFKQGEMCVDGSTIGPGWNIAHGTAVRMDFIPNWKKGIPLDQLPFAFEDFEIIPQANAGRDRYYSYEHGISFEADVNKLVREVHFFPPISMSYMRCSSE
jgi:hypothetical protein